MTFDQKKSVQTINQLSFILEVNKKTLLLTNSSNLYQKDQISANSKGKYKQNAAI